MSAYLLLLLFILLSITYPLTLKLAGMRFDFESGPISISTWLLLGLLITYPFFGHLLLAKISYLIAHPALLSLILAKGLLFWILFHDSLALASQSLSAQS